MCLQRRELFKSVAWCVSVDYKSVAQCVIVCVFVLGRGGSRVALLVDASTDVDIYSKLYF